MDEQTERRLIELLNRQQAISVERRALLDRLWVLEQESEEKRLESLKLMADSELNLIIALDGHVDNVRFGRRTDGGKETRP